MIYQFEKRVPPARPEPDTPQVVNVNYKIIIAGYVVEKIFAVPGNPKPKVIGRKPVPGATISVSFGNEKEMCQNGDGYFSFEAAQQTDYRFFASQEGIPECRYFFFHQRYRTRPGQPGSRHLK